MMEKSYEACLKKQRIPELEALLYRLDAEEFGQCQRKDDMIRLAAELIPQQLDDIVCVLRMEQAAALRAQLAGNPEGTVSLKCVNRDPVLLKAVEVLAPFGLAWREAGCWQLRSCVREMLQEAADVELKFADMLSDLMQGLLMHTGMLPQETLLDWLLNWLDDGDENATEAIEGMADRVLRLRYGLDALYAGEEDLWIVSEDLLDPDALYERLHEPHIAALPWLEYRVEDMLYAARQTGVPGSGELYLPLAQWLHGHGLPLENCANFIIHLVRMIQNGMGVQVMPEILALVELRGETDMDELLKVMNTLHNSIPLWDNKGRSAWELVRPVQPAAAKADFPGRNSPCPCGSGKKYKHCCGRMLH